VSTPFDYIPPGAPRSHVPAQDDAEKLRRLREWGFDVGPDTKIICRGCGKAAVWAKAAKEGEWEAISCPSSPPCKPADAKPIGATS
jgi:hypothetical protein